MSGARVVHATSDGIVVVKVDLGTAYANQMGEKDLSADDQLNRFFAWGRSCITS